MTSDLLPQNEKEFRSKNYWDKFFKIRGNEAFEWYGEYENMSELLDKYIKFNDGILMIGCGNSTLSEKMFDNGLRNITNIDISNIVIQQMIAKNKERKEMKFLKMDMLNMEFSNESFEIVLDKGTLDALMSDQRDEVKDECEKMFNEIDRVLKSNGRYICISLAQSHIAKRIVETFAQKGWIIRIHKLNEYDIDFFLPVFVFVITKMKIALKSPIIEFKAENENTNFERLNDTNHALLKIKEYQQFGLAKFYISNNEVDLNDDFYVHLYDLNSRNEPRYTIYIVDNKNSSVSSNCLAAFVVPLGKEFEWLFGTKDGRMELAIQAKYNRLLVVHLNRSHTYENIDQIIKELSSKVMELAPKKMSKSYKVPILSEGADVDIRDIKYKGNSKFSGEFYIEDVKSNDDSIPTRRLIFQKINPIIQTEIVLKKDETAKKNKNKAKNLKPNYEYFLEDYFATLITHLYILNKRKDNPLKILIIGLGGGSLTMYCKQWIENCEIDAVEIDEEIVKSAKDWFGLVEDKKTRVFVDDGLKFIENAAASGKKWDIVIIDVNNDNVESDLWCPTKEFVEVEFLKNSNSILNNQGVFMVNVICRNENLKQQIFENFKSIWPSIFVNKLKKSRNEIIFCSNDDQLFKKYDFNNDQNFIKITNDTNKSLFIEMSDNLIKLK